MGKIKELRKRIFNKIGNKEFWNSPIICEGCNKEVKSVSRNILLGNLKWLCENYEVTN